MAEPEFRYPELGPWTEPPPLTLAGILPMNQVLARTDQGTVVLTEIRAYPTGCWWEIVAAVRRPATQVARRRGWNTMAGFAADADQLPPELLWPLPQAEAFELVLEYPVIGVAETRVPIDGAAIVAAASGSSPYVS